MAPEDERSPANANDRAINKLREDLARISQRLTPEIEPAPVYCVQPSRVQSVSAAPTQNEHS